MMTLYHLLHQSGMSHDTLLWTGGGETEEAVKRSKACHVAGLWSDSRAVQKGGLFAVFDGTHHKGEAFIEDAFTRGACVLLVHGQRTRHIMQAYDHIPSFFIVWDDMPRRCFALMAAAWFSHKQPSFIAAVTGTNGKTSVASFARQLWDYGGNHSASLGTLGVSHGIHSEHKTPSPSFTSSRGHSLTTLDAYSLHESLAWLEGVGVSHAIMEASSHGLSQHRVDGVRVDVAACTNMGRDHLDYHLTMEAYRRAKARLFFDVVEDDGCCVLNLDDEVNMEWHDELTSQGRRLMSYGRHEASTLRLVRVDKNEGSKEALMEVSCVIAYEGREYRLRLPSYMSPYGFQVMNVLCACAIVLGSGMACERVFESVCHLRAVPGRLQKVARASDGCGCLYIDYAHTADALCAVLETLAVLKTKSASLWVVFGCGGERDKGKRIEMGRCAETLADKSIITDDNPRQEEAASIRRDIMKGFTHMPMEVPSRDKAIACVMERAGCDDIILIAGKGHEDYQIVGRECLPFSDEACVHGFCESSTRWEAIV